MNKNLFTLLLVPALIAAGTARAAQEAIVSSKGISGLYLSDGSAGHFNGNTWSYDLGMTQLFDGEFDPGVMMSTAGSYVLVDLDQALSGGYFVTKIVIGTKNTITYSLYTSTNGTTWAGVTNAVGVSANGKYSYVVNDFATQVKFVWDTTIHAVQTVSEIQVWGIDPSEMGCRHPSFTEWEPVPGTATCTEPGVDRHKCIFCGEAFDRTSELLPPLGHDYVETLSRKGTSSSYGEGGVSCSRCEWSAVFNIPLDLTALGGVASHFLVQFTDLSVSSYQPFSAPSNLINNNWNYVYQDWVAATRSHDEYVQFDFGVEIDLTKIDFSVHNHTQIVEFYKVEGDTETKIAEVAMTEAESGSELRSQVFFRGVSLQTLRVRFTDSIGVPVNGTRPVGMSELHPWGTVKGAGKLDVLRSKILLY